MSRVVRPDEQFSECLLDLVALPAARGAIMEGITLTLAEDPTSGTYLTGGIEDPMAMWTFIIPEAPGWNTPRMRALYTFDAEFLNLHWLELAPV